VNRLPRSFAAKVESTSVRSDLPAALGGRAHHANPFDVGLIELCDQAAKKCSGRSIPVHPDVAKALDAWRQVAPSSEYVIASERGGSTDVKGFEQLQTYIYFPVNS
jgi:hypothetical protein